MSYKIGDKVETSLGIAKINSILNSGDVKIYNAIIKNKFIISFYKSELKPYKSAREKLLSGVLKPVYEDETILHLESEVTNTTLKIYKKGKAIHMSNYIDLELLKILVQYLEELESIKGVKEC